MSWPRLARDIKKVARSINASNLTTEQLEDAAMIFMRELGFEADKEKVDVWAEYTHEIPDTGHKIYTKGNRFHLDYWFGPDVDPMTIPKLITDTGEGLAKMFDTIFNDKEEES